MLIFNNYLIQGVIADIMYSITRRRIKSSFGVSWGIV